MIMHSVALPATNQEENLIIPISPSLSIEPFVALTARIKTSDKAVAAGLNCLRESMAPGDFTKYIESLVDIRIGKGTLWLLTIRPCTKRCWSVIICCNCAMLLPDYASES